MDQAMWRRAKAVFQRVCEAEPDRRADLLDTLSEGDTALRREVEGLLEAHEAAARSEGAGPREAAPEPGERPGDVIHRFKLLQEIGTGGFGTVYMAEQSEPVRRKVALKIVKLGMDSKQVVARFEAERQALAVMDHPNIAKVLDGGTTATGRPYFVMELVKGVPLIEYCDKAGLDTAERLGLFRQVCHAVQHAHQKGIIHRDLKPANVLVALQGGVPVPKVIDFGIAKALDRHLTEKTLFTESRQIIGTPEYMAPEQAEFTNLDIDTRADIYSLGVVLYELLTGTKPFDLQKLLEQGYGEMLRTIREVDPPKPSTRLSTLGDQLPLVAKRRHTEPARLNRLLRGDLDWIVMKALEKDRSRRYETADAFAADVGRHLADEPVLARPPSRAYRLRKYVKRHGVGVLAGATAAAALLVGAGVALAGWSTASVQRDRAEAARTQAEQAAETARQAFRVLGGMLAEGSPDRLGPRATLAQLLAAVEEDLPDLARRSPGAEAVVRNAFATAYRDQGRTQEAERHAARAYELAEAVYGPDAELTLECLGNRAVFLSVSGEQEEALRLQRRVVDGFRRLPDARPEDLAAKLTNLALMIPGTTQGETEERDALLEEAARLFEEADGTDATYLYVPLARLAEAESEAGRHDDAVRLARRALDLRLRHRGAGHPVVGRGHDTLGNVLLSAGKTPEAERELERAAVIFDDLGEERGDRWTVANNLGCLRLMQGRYQEAVDLLGGVVTWRAENLGEHDRSTLQVRLNLGAAHNALGNADAAAEQYTLALQGLRQSGLGTTMDCARALRNLAILERQQGRRESSVQHHREALEILRALHGGDHPQIALSLHTLAIALADSRELDDAEACAREGLEMARRLSKEPSNLEAHFLHTFAFLAHCRDDLDSALEYTRQQLEMLQTLLGMDHPGVGVAHGDLAMILGRMGRREEAAPHFERALALVTPAVGPEHPQVLQLRGQSLWTDLFAGHDADPDRAAALHADNVRAFGEHDMRTLRALRLLGLARIGAGELEPAEGCLEVVIGVLTSLEEPDDVQTRELRIARADLGMLRVRQERYEDAEALLLPAWEGVAPPTDVRSGKTETASRLADLYETWGKPEEAATWRAKADEGE